MLVDRPASLNNIRVSGPGINPKYVRANTPIHFKVDAAQSPKGNLDVKMTTDRGEFLRQKKLFIFIYLKCLNPNRVLHRVNNKTRF